jgi:hypothetical protein
VTFHGTHRGEFQGIPPTDKQVTFSGIEVDRMVGGKVEEHWVELDLLGLMQQLGAIPEPGQEEEARTAEEEQEEKGLMDKAKEKLTGQ